MQGIEPQGLVLVVLEGEEIGQGSPLDQGLRMDHRLPAITRGILVEHLQGAGLGQGPDHRLQDLGIERHRAQAQAVGDDAHPLFVEQGPVQLMEQPLPQPFQPPRRHRLGDQVTHLAQGVLPDQLVFMHILPMRR